MHAVLRRLREHLEKLEACGKWSFFWRVWLSATIVGFLVGNATHVLFPAGARSDLAGLSLARLIALVAIIGPLFETLFCQCLPIELAASLGFRRWIRLTISIVPFALLHHFAGVPTVVAAGAIGGFYFAFTYERWRTESIFVGVLMTFLIHSSFNLTSIFGMLVFSR